MDIDEFVRRSEEIDRQYAKDREDYGEDTAQGLRNLAILTLGSPDDDPEYIQDPEDQDSESEDS